MAGILIMIAIDMKELFQQGIKLGQILMIVLIDLAKFRLTGLKLGMLLCKTRQPRDQIYNGFYPTSSFTPFSKDFFLVLSISHSPKNFLPPLPAEARFILFVVQYNLGTEVTVRPPF